jgi:molecular chaperone GrpE
MKEKHKHKHSGDGHAPAPNADTKPGGAPPDDSDQGNRFDGAIPAAGTDELAELRRQAAEAQDRYLRGQAELENTRKRMRREMEDERRYAELRLLEDLLPVIDNINRAIEAAEKNADAASLLAGFKMVSQQLGAVLERHHLSPIAAEGEPFDPAVHQAIMQQPSDEHPENTVVGVGLAGYKLHDRVVRPAQVVVSKKGR